MYSSPSPSVCFVCLRLLPLTLACPPPRLCALPIQLSAPKRKKQKIPRPVASHAIACCKPQLTCSNSLTTTSNTTAAAADCCCVVGLHPSAAARGR
ncbi:hypothetical protein HDK64DRAFT_118058 [Phyllosticta capitalensis]